MRLTSKTELQSVKEKEGDCDCFTREKLDYKKMATCAGQGLEAVTQCQMSRKMLEANRL